MRVTLVAPLVAPLRAVPTGGAQAVVCDLARGLLGAGVDVELVAAPGSRVPGVRVRRAPGGPFPDDLLPLGRTDLRPPAAPPTELGARQLPTWLRLAAEIVHRPPQILHLHAMDWPAFATTAATGIPVIHTLHLGPVDPAATAVAAAVARCRPRPRFLAPSGTLAAAWRAHVPVDAVIPNGVDPATVPFGAAPVRDLAVVAGRISPEKGTDLAIAAALRAGLRVVVAGAAYDRTFWAEHVAPLADGDRVRLLGPLSRRRLVRLLGRAAVAVQASRWAEPFGMVAVEAAMAGTPVAVTPCGALPDVVDASMGRVAERTDVDAVAAAIVAALGLDRAGVRRAAVRRHSLERMISRHLRLYAGLTGHASPSS